MWGIVKNIRSVILPHSLQYVFTQREVAPVVMRSSRECDVVVVAQSDYLEGNIAQLECTM